MRKLRKALSVQFERKVPFLSIYFCLYNVEGLYYKFIYTYKMKYGSEQYKNMENFVEA